MKTDPESFIRANTGIVAPPHVPEIRLHLASEAHELWLKTEEELEEIGLPPPFWAFAWAGGQGLARYILDNPKYRGLTEYYFRHDGEAHCLGYGLHEAILPKAA